MDPVGLVAAPVILLSSASGKSLLSVADVCSDEAKIC